MSGQEIIPPVIGDYLFTVNFNVDPVLHGIAGGPFGNRRIGYVTGGTFEGPRMKGEVLPGGGNWSMGGRLDDNTNSGTFDARVILKTDDGALIYMTYTGRTRVPDDVASKLADKANVDSLDSTLYSLRIAPLFETGDPRYYWLNGVLAVGRGQATGRGARHHVFAIG